MRTITILVCAVGALVSGCVSTTAVPLTAGSASAMSGQSIAHTTRKKADFIAMTPGKASFAMVGAFAMIAAGNDLVARNNIEDPAAGIGADLARALSSAKGATVVEAPVVVQNGKPEDLAASVGARYVVDVATIGWSYVYQPSDWTAFSVSYSSQLRVIDTQTKVVVAKGACGWTTPKTEKLPTQEALLADGAALLKSQLATAAAECTAAYKRDILGGL
jgi:hypothetical protein